MLEVAAYAALTTVGCLAVAGAVFLATGATIATGGVALVLVVGAVVGITAGLTGADLNTSVMADILGGVLEVAAYAALTTVGCLAVAGAVSFYDGSARDAGHGGPF
ncbi:hypothetical protein [Mycobacterium tuberculosis]|uniref:hypothetical protein n=1 Tax=Mycobacterium tuberculosis TaxID=1773 RepID=UPI002711E8C8|nr:hypothetical protein [Mycobacterium tuberculosis]